MTDDLREQIKIKKGETDDEYEIRICSLHDEYDLTWDDITAIINSALDQNYTESRYRKMWKMYNLGVRNTAIQRRMRNKDEGDYLKNENIDIDAIREEIDEANIDIDPEDIELREKYATMADRIAYIRELRQDARFERFYKNIADAIVKTGKPVVPVYIGPKAAKNNKKYVLPLADLHLGAAFESINNTYSISEAKRRIDAAATYVKDFVQDHGIKELTVISLGDLIQGILRTSDLKLNETDVVNAFVYAVRLIAGFLNAISAYCYVDYIHVCYSNHEQPRYLGTKASELAGEDMGKISFAYLQDVLAANPRIKVRGDVDKDYYEFDIFKFKCFAAHGHQVKNLNEISKDLANRHRTFYDYVFLAHSHSAKEFISAEGEHHDIEVLVAPSLIGSDPYADKLFVGSKAAIKIFGFDEKFGHTESYKFILN